MRKAELLKGSTELVLLSLLARKDMYGYEMIEQLKLLSDGYLHYKEGMLYPALKRLEEKEYLKSYWRDSLEGPKRKYYYATKLGINQFQEQWDEWNAFQQVIQKVITHTSGHTQK
ncbi:PadR family transcriptional regulator [Peribacillus sp. SI8-4]|uniref:PadR family transcriptional regulator n=1 Tax=Peribacillus sp. SI8-4 TaxID=3048009 RepID=UPI002553F593|nr:PadR family transcriptional regulator [Peribacillus sp. SI8-4]